jgi:hypothetical protein
LFLSFNAKIKSHDIEKMYKKTSEHNATQKVLVIKEMKFQACFLHLQERYNVCATGAYIEEN